MRAVSLFDRFSVGATTHRHPFTRLAAALAIAVIGVMFLPGAQSRALAVPAGGLVQPTGATFAATLPTPYRVDTNRPSVMREFPGALSATAYYASPAKGDILAAAAPVPPAPTYLVMAAVFPSDEVADGYVQTVGRLPGMKPVLIQTLAGYHALSREGSPINKGNTVNQPRAFESVLTVAADSTVYFAFAFTRTATAARAFTHSLQPLGGGPEAFAPSGTHVAQLGVVSPHSQAYRYGRYTAYGLLTLLVVGIIFKYANKSRGSGSSPQSSAQYGAPPGGPAAPAPNAQFAWINQGPPAPVAPPPSSPPVDPSP